MDNVQIMSKLWFDYINETRPLRNFSRSIQYTRCILFHSNPVFIKDVRYGRLAPSLLSHKECCSNHVLRLRNVKSQRSQSSRVYPNPTLPSLLQPLRPTLQDRLLLVNLGLMICQELKGYIVAILPSQNNALPRTRRRGALVILHVRYE